MNQDKNQVSKPDIVNRIEEISIDDLIELAESNLLSAPHYLSESIIQRSQSVQVQLPMQIEAHTKQLSKKMQMFYYTMKVSIAMVCTLILLSVSTNIPNGLQSGINAIAHPISQKATEFSESMSERSDKWDETIKKMKENMNQTILGGNENEQNN